MVVLFVTKGEDSKRIQYVSIELKEQTTSKIIHCIISNKVERLKTLLMTIERINFLFQNGFITEEEHCELMTIAKSKNRLYTRANYLTLILALTGYFFMLSYTKNGHDFALLSNGNERLWAGTIFSVLSTGVFIESKKYRNNVFIERAGYGYIGLGIAFSLLIIVIPVWIMSAN